MNSVIYLVAILIIGASAVFSFLNRQAHIDLTQETYDFRVKIDDLERKIAFAEGRRHKVDDFKEEGDMVQTVEDAVKVITQRALSGQRELVFNKPSDPYNKDVDGVVLSFLPYNKLVAQDQTAQLEYIHKPAVDILVGEGKLEAVKAVGIAVESHVESILIPNIRNLNGSIQVEQGKKENLASDIEEYVEAEAKISKMFESEGISTLQGGKDKLVSLEDSRKRLINEQDSLTKEQVTLTEKRDNNNGIIADQNDYFAERKISLGTNDKLFKLAAIDFEWGFGVIKTDETTKFFVNQKLMIVRGRKYLGDVIVTAVEPGRVMVNIVYKSVPAGIVFRVGDTVMLAEPADR